MQDECGDGQQDDPGIGDAVLQQPALSPQRGGCGPDEQYAQHSQRRAAGGGGVDDEGKNPVGLFPLSLPHGLGDEGPAAGAEHESRTPHDHQHGIDKIHGGKGGFAHIIGDEKAVHHAVDGGEHHHHNGRQGVAQQFGIGKMV